jgi:hypothetical protein
MNDATAVISTLPAKAARILAVEYSSPNPKPSRIRKRSCGPGKVVDGGSRRRAGPRDRPGREGGGCAVQRGNDLGRRDGAVVHGGRRARSGVATEDAAGPRPLVLLGHGGSDHKTAPRLVARARRYVTRCGFAVAAVDAPGWGGRPVPAAYEPYDAEIRGLAGAALGDAFARRAVIIAELAVPEWQATIDALAALDWIGPGPVGYWGVSLGSAIGVPLVAAEPRIGAAVLGLMGHQTLAAAAPRSLSRWSSTCSGTTNSCRGRRVSRCSTPSARRRRRCTPIRRPRGGAAVRDRQLRAVLRAPPGGLGQLR